MTELEIIQSRNESLHAVATLINSLCQLNSPVPEVRAAAHEAVLRVLKSI